MHKKINYKILVKKYGKAFMIRNFLVFKMFEECIQPKSLIPREEMKMWWQVNFPWHYHRNWHGEAKRIDTSCGGRPPIALHHH